MGKPVTLRPNRRRSRIVQAKRAERMVRATCCNWDVPESEIVFTETVKGETFTCCRDCSDDGMAESSLVLR